MFLQNHRDIYIFLKSSYGLLIDVFNSFWFVYPLHYQGYTVSLPDLDKAVTEPSMNSSEDLYQGCAYVSCVKTAGLIQASSQVCLQNRNNKRESNHYKNLCVKCIQKSCHFKYSLLYSAIGPALQC